MNNGFCAACSFCASALIWAGSPAGRVALTDIGFAGAASASSRWIGTEMCLDRARAEANSVKARSINWYAAGAVNATSDQSQTVSAAARWSFIWCNCPLRAAVSSRHEDSTSTGTESL